MLGNAVQSAFHADTVADVQADAEQLRDLLDRTKLHSTEDFAALLTSWRQHGGLANDEHQKDLCYIHCQPEQVYSRETLRLTAHRHVERTMDLRIRPHRECASEREYDPYNHQNDVFDMQQLIYLAQPDMHFLTCDRGFRRARQSSQYDRITLGTAPYLP